MCNPLSSTKASNLTWSSLSVLTSASLDSRVIPGSRTGDWLEGASDGSGKKVSSFVVLRDIVRCEISVASERRWFTNDGFGWSRVRRRSHICTRRNRLWPLGRRTLHGSASPAISRAEVQICAPGDRVWDKTEFPFTKEEGVPDTRPDDFTQPSH